MIYDSITQTIGKTPVVKIKTPDGQASVYVKLEYFNPGGSVKDRIALGIIEGMERDGRLVKGMTIVEPTSGNTGIGMALVAAAKDYQTIFTMPETMSIERRKLMQGYGAQLVLTKGEKGMKGAIAKALEIVDSRNDAVMLGQFTNEYNPMSHMKTTAEELIADFDGKIDVFVAGVGTGGTITGVGSIFRKNGMATKLVAVEPDASPVLSGGSPAPHKIQGIGAGFIPDILQVDLIDQIVQVSAEDAIMTSRELAVSEGLLLGISSGSAIYAAKLQAAELNEDQNVVVIAADNGERYLSTVLFEDL